MSPPLREKGLYYGIREYDKVKCELVKIIKDLIVAPCQVYIDSEIIYIVFDDDYGSCYQIAYALGISDSYVNHISVLTNISYHYAIPLEFLR